MDLYAEFKEPSARFRQAPFWFWNHELEKETLDWQIDQMKEKGLGGFVMHARHGLITPYLSDEWFEAIRFCCGKARENGFQGGGGGRVQRERRPVMVCKHRGECEVGEHPRACIGWVQGGSPPERRPSTERPQFRYEARGQRPCALVVLAGDARH